MIVDPYESFGLGCLCGLFYMGGIILLNKILFLLKEREDGKHTWC